MNLYNFIVLLSAGRSVVPTESWMCINHVVSRYFHEATTFILLGEDTPPLQMLQQKPVLLVTEDVSSWTIPSHQRPDVLFIGNNHQKLVCESRGRTVVVLHNLEGADSFFKNCRLYEVVVLLPTQSGCSAYVFSSSQKSSELILVDVWKGGSFINGAELFSLRLPEDLSGYPLTVAMAVCPPDVLEVGGVFTGPAVSIWIAIARSLSLAVSHAPINQDEVRSTNNSLSGFLKVLLEGDADLIVDCLGLTPDRVLYADPLPLYAEGTVDWSVPAPRALPFSSGIYTAFTVQIWCMIALTLILVSSIIHISSGHSRTWLQWFYSALRITLGQTHGVVFSKSWLVAFFQLYCVHIIWFYQSTLLVHLFTLPYEKPIETIEEVLDRGLTIWSLKLHHYILSLSSLWPLITEKGLYKMADRMNLSLITEERTAAFLSTISDDMDAYVAMYPGVPLETKVRFLEQPFIRGSTHFYMARNHPLIPVLSIKMLRLFESGMFLHKLNLDYIPQKYVVSLVGEYRKPLRSENLLSAYYIYMGLASLSCLVFFYELHSETTVRFCQGVRRNFISYFRLSVVQSLLSIGSRCLSKNIPEAMKKT